MGAMILGYEAGRDQRKRQVIGWLESAVLAGVGILLPMLCFAASFNRYPGSPDYQQASWYQYLILVPSVPASWPFAPLLFAATYAMAVLVIAPHRVAQSWMLRWALYSGTILSAQYALIQAIAIADPRAPLSLGTLLAIVAGAIATLMALGALWIVPRLPRIKPAYWMPCAILIPIVAVVCWRITLPVVLLSAMLIAFVAPALTLAAYLRVSFIVWKLARQDPGASGQIRLRVPLVWIATYGTMWVVAFISAIDLYNSLPKTPPDC